MTAPKAARRRAGVLGVAGMRAGVAHTSRMLRSGVPTGFIRSAEALAASPMHTTARISAAGRPCRDPFQLSRCGGDGGLGDILSHSTGHLRGTPQQGRTKRWADKSITRVTFVGRLRPARRERVRARQGALSRKQRCTATSIFVVVLPLRLCGSLRIVFNMASHRIWTRYIHGARSALAPRIMSADKVPGVKMANSGAVRIFCYSALENSCCDSLRF